MPRPNGVNHLDSRRSWWLDMIEQPSEDQPAAWLHLVNMPRVMCVPVMFSVKSPQAASGTKVAAQSTGGRRGRVALAQGKFFTLFSFLFGWGFATQFLRAEERGAVAGFPRQYLRRSAVLSLIGVVHIALLSEGDILLLYAILGLLLLPLRRARPEILLRWVKWLLIVPAAASVLMFGALALGRAFPDGAEEIAVSDRETAEVFDAEARTTMAA